MQDEWFGLRGRTNGHDRALDYRKGTAEMVIKDTDLSMQLSRYGGAPDGAERERGSNVGYSGNEGGQRQYRRWPRLVGKWWVWVEEDGPRS